MWNLRSSISILARVEVLISGGQIWRESSLLIDNRIPVAWLSLPNQSVFNRSIEATVFIGEYYQFNALGTRIESINLIRFFKHQSCLDDYFLSSRVVKVFCFEYLINHQTWKKLFLIELGNSARHVWLKCRKAGGGGGGGGVELPTILLYAENAS